MIIGFIGMMGSGKGTAGAHLCEAHGFQAVSFAGILKDAVATIFRWPRELLEGDTSSSRAFREALDPEWSKALGYDVTPRLILQKMGTEAGRNVFGENLWTHALFNSIDYKNKNYVITDVRFPNEMTAIKDHGGLNIYISRGEDPDWFPAAKEAKEYISKYGMAGTTLKEYDATAPAIHISEWAWYGEPVDDAITNDDTVLTLKSKVDTMVTLIKFSQEQNENQQGNNSYPTIVSVDQREYHIQKGEQAS